MKAQYMGLPTHHQPKKYRTHSALQLHWNRSVSLKMSKFRKSWFSNFSILWGRAFESCVSFESWSAPLYMHVLKYNPCPFPRTFNQLHNLLRIEYISTWSCINKIQNFGENLISWIWHVMKVRKMLKHAQMLFFMEL